MNTLRSGSKQVKQTVQDLAEFLLATNFREDVHLLTGVALANMVKDLDLVVISNRLLVVIMIAGESTDAGILTQLREQCYELLSQNPHLAQYRVRAIWYGDSFPAAAPDTNCFSTPDQVAQFIQNETDRFSASDSGEAEQTAAWLLELEQQSTATENHNRVGRGLLCLQEGLTVYVQQEMEQALGKNWRDQALNTLGRHSEWRRQRPDEIHWDAQALLVLMWDNWRDVFDGKLGRSARTWVSELREVRNQWAHQEPFSNEDAYRALDTMLRLLQAIQAPQAVAVEMERSALLRRQYEAQNSATTIPVSAMPDWVEAVDPPYVEGLPDRNNWSSTLRDSAQAAWQKVSARIENSRQKQVRPADINALLTRAIADDKYWQEDARYVKTLPNRYTIEIGQENYEAHYLPLRSRLIEQWKSHVIKQMNAMIHRGKYNTPPNAAIEILLTAVPGQGMDYAKVIPSFSLNFVSDSLPAFCLELIYPSGSSTWALSREEINTIGCASQCSICLTMPEIELVSNQHAFIQYDKGNFYLFDGAYSGTPGRSARPSTNGTYIETMKVEPNRGYQLHDGDKITLAPRYEQEIMRQDKGMVVLRFRKSKT